MDAEWWEVRYRGDPAEYDWYVSAREVADVIAPLVAREEDEILHVGCGTSGLAAELYLRGRRFITNIDTSRTCVGAMGERFAAMGDMQFVEMDATRLPKDLSAVFGAVLDKALLDTLLCDPRGKDLSERYLSEVRRVLRPGGVFVCVSHSEGRKNLLASHLRVPLQQIKVQTIPKPVVPGIEMGSSSAYHVYIVRN